ncbi:MAG: preprotein translocase subunit SecE [Planctomycetes bacterium]|nr:preprotein translocase subunit SecE [Planctomycetota bacterium]
MGAFFQELFQVGLYKRSQGRVTRQVTWAALAGACLFGCAQLMARLVEQPAAVRYGVPLLIFACCAWISYRIVNLPRFADFLIAVQAEMNKVSWPTQAELIRSSIVVIFVIFFLAVILWGFDQVWMLLFQILGLLGREP